MDSDDALLPGERTPIRKAAAGRAANDADAIVAFGTDGQPYPLDKWQAHVDNVRHLAVSVFVFSAGRLLLQRRAASKYHSGGLWANTCCTHPRWQEAPLACARRRLHEELGIDLALHAFGRIDYTAPVGSAPPRDGRAAVPLYENESVRCYAGHADAATLLTDPDPLEVDELRWVDLDTLVREVARYPARYTAWLRIYLTRHRALLEQVVQPADILST